MELKPMYQRVIGLDAHQAKISACALAQQPDGTVTIEHREFGAFKRDRKAQSLAVRNRGYTPVAFDDPERFKRNAFFEELPLLARPHGADPEGRANPSQRYLMDVARSARDASQLVREAWARYKSPVDYGIVPSHLNKGQH